MAQPAGPVRQAASSWEPTDIHDRLIPSLGWGPSTSGANAQPKRRDGSGERRWPDGAYLIDQRGLRRRRPCACARTRAAGACSCGGPKVPAPSLARPPARQAGCGRRSRSRQRGPRRATRSAGDLDEALAIGDERLNPIARANLVDGLAVDPSTRTWPPSHNRVASGRVLTRRTAHGQRSIRARRWQGDPSRVQGWRGSRGRRGGRCRRPRLVDGAARRASCWPGCGSRPVPTIRWVWSGREDLNLRLHRPERCALPGCATPRPGCSLNRACG